MRDNLVRTVGIEPTVCEILSLVRLPFRHVRVVGMPGLEPGSHYSRRLSTYCVYQFRHIPVVGRPGLEPGELSLLRRATLPDLPSGPDLVDGEGICTLTAFTAALQADGLTRAQPIQTEISSIEKRKSARNPKVSDAEITWKRVGYRTPNLAVSSAFETGLHPVRHPPHYGSGASEPLPRRMNSIAIGNNAIA